MKKPLAFVDVETTGLNPQLHEIIEISIIKVCPIHGTTNFTRKITPLHIEYADTKALEINGYNKKEWQDSEDCEMVMSKVSDMLAGCTLVGHNIRFDEEFIAETCFRHGIKTRYNRRLIDTVTLAHEHLYHLESVSMDSIRKYLVAVGKAELVLEACEAPIASTEPVIESKPTDSDEVDFSQMTKSQIETYGRKLGIELDRRKNKTDLIAKLEEFISKQEES